MRDELKLSFIVLPESFSLPHTLRDQLSGLFRYFRTGEVSAGSSWPPLGVLYLGTILQEAGYEVSVLDAALRKWDLKRVEDWVRREDPDVVGLSTFTGNFVHAAELARRIKEASPDVKVVMGGHHVTFTADRTLREFPFVDLVVRGEAEGTIVGVMRALEGRKELKELRGVSYGEDGRVVHLPPANPLTDLDALPMPDRSLILDEYRGTVGPVSFGTGRLTTVITSRGCPFHCTFCSCTAFRGNLCKFRSPENLMGELEVLAGEGYREIGMVDDSFCLVRKRVERICELIEQRHLEFTWWCESRVDAVSYEMFRTMKRAGCETVFFGFESGVQRILDYYRKGITPEQSVRAVRAARKAGMNTVGTFIVGAPTETREEVSQTLRFAERLGVDVVGIGPLWVYPGTQVWSEMVSENRELEEKYWKTGFAPVELGMCGYSAEWLGEEIGRTLRKFYLNPLYLSGQLVRCLRDPYRRRAVSERIRSWLC
ncbi:MAG: radical SAM protein [Candidatus Hadarchaeales archaeon]